LKTGRHRPIKPNVEEAMNPNVQTASARQTAGAFDVIPTGSALGAEVRGVDLGDLDDATFERLMQAWHQHSVVLVRGQSLSDQDLIAFSRRLGDLDWAPIQENGRRFVEGLPEIYIVSNVKVDGEPIGSLGDGEAVWHTDMSYLEVPPKASLLYSLEVPPTGGNTSFCSMYRIYQALPQRLKDRIADLKIKHDGTYNSGGLCAPRSDADRRPGHLARRSASAGLHASGHGPAHALSRAPPQRVSRRTQASGFRDTAG
jgi:taurine dioxygenase